VVFLRNGGKPGCKISIFLRHALAWRKKYFFIPLALAFNPF